MRGVGSNSGGGGKTGSQGSGALRYDMQAGMTYITMLHASCQQCKGAGGRTKRGMQQHGGEWMHGQRGRGCPSATVGDRPRKEHDSGQRQGKGSRGGVWQQQGGQQLDKVGIDVGLQQAEVCREEMYMGLVGNSNSARGGHVGGGVRQLHR